MVHVVHLPWYATVFRGDKLEEALKEIAPVALRYGATAYTVHRSLDDRYKFDHMTWIESKLDWERFWEGPEMIRWRAKYSSWFQVPVVYWWADEVCADSVVENGTAEQAAEPAA